MTRPKTKEAQAVEIFNRLADLDIGDVEGAVQLLFRLRRMDSNCVDPTVKVSRADAALIAGYRDEAIESLDQAYQLRSRGDLADLQRLQLLQMMAGQVSRAVELARLLLDKPGIIANEKTVGNLISTALWTGDLDLLNEIMHKEKEADLHNASEDAEILSSSDLSAILPTHQRVVREVLRRCQVSVWSRIDILEDGRPVVVNLYHFDGTKTIRARLENELEEALDAYYRGKGLNDSVWRGKIITIITEAPRHAGADLLRGKTAA